MLRIDCHTFTSVLLSACPQTLGSKRDESIKYKSIYCPKWAHISSVLSLVHSDRETGLGSSHFSSRPQLADFFSILGFGCLAIRGSSWHQHGRIATSPNIDCGKSQLCTKGALIPYEVL